MSYQPVIPFNGLAGWTFLQRTMSSQKEMLAATPVAQRDETYFRTRIGKISSAQELVDDWRLLRISLTAFGLKDDVNNRAFIRKVLEGNLSEPSALANKLADKRYLAMAHGFGFGTGQPRTGQAGFADAVIAAYQSQSFELAVGEQNDTMRLALNAERELTQIASGSSNVNTKWYSIMGNAPLRKVVETAFGLPSSFAQLDLEQQLKTLKSKAASQLGSSDPAILKEPAAMEKLIRNYLIRSDSAASSGYSPAHSALQLLRGL